VNRPADHQVAAFVALAAAATLLLLRLAADLYWPAGTDQAMWGLSALNLVTGSSVHLPPLYPLLTGILHLLGAPLVPAGAGVSLAAASLVPALIYLLARELGAQPRWGLAASAACLLAPELTIFGLRLQPDALAALGFTAAALAAARFLRRQSPGNLVAVLLLAALLPLVREHGLLVSGLLAAALLVAPGTASMRLLRLALVVGVVLLAPAMGGASPGLPWTTPWFSRVTEAMDAAEQAQIPGFVLKQRGLEREQGEAVFLAGDRLGIAIYYLRHALKEGSYLWGWLVLGLLALPGLTRRWWRGPLVGLLPPFAVLAVFSEPRHAAVGVPVAMAIVAATRGFWHIKGWMLRALAAVAVVGGLLYAPAILKNAEGEIQGVQDMYIFGANVCEVVEEGALAAGAPGAFLFCPLPLHAPRQQITAADWKTWFVGPSPPSEAWMLVPESTRDLPVYRLLPELQGDARPCGDAFPPPGLPYHSTGPRPVVMEPDCEALPDEVVLMLAHLPYSTSPREKPDPGAPR